MATVVAHVNGIELAYQIFGAGSPLVLLHGGFGSVEMYGPNVELLAAGHRVIGVDLQSHGRSPAADRPMRFETMADDIAALITDLKLERADVMGFFAWRRSRVAHRDPASSTRGAARSGLDRLQEKRMVSGDDRRHGCDGSRDCGTVEAQPDV